jgi:hypothetical protein
MLQEEVQRKAHSPSPIGQEPSISAMQPHRCRTEDMRTSENFLKAKFAEFIFHALRVIWASERKARASGSAPVPTFPSRHCRVLYMRPTT